MKRLFLILIMLLSLNHCMGYNPMNLVDLENVSLSNEHTATKQFETTNFSSVVVKSSSYVTISKGDYNVEIKTSQNIVDSVNVDVKNSELVISNSKGNIFSKDVQVHVTAPNLSNVKLEGASEADIFGFSLDNLHLDISGASKVTMGSNRIKLLCLDISGASKITLSQDYPNHFDSVTGQVSGASYVLEDTTNERFVTNTYLSESYDDIQVYRRDPHHEATSDTSGNTDQDGTPSNQTNPDSTSSAPDTTQNQTSNTGSTTETGADTTGSTSTTNTTSTTTTTTTNNNTTNNYYITNNYYNQATADGTTDSSGNPNNGNGSDANDTASFPEVYFIGNLTIHASGASRVDLQNISLAYASIELSGASEMILAFENNAKITGSVSGGSQLFYYGNPSFINIETSGISSAKKL